MSDPYDTYYDQYGCLVTPERPAVTRVPSRVDAVPVIGWDAGANSITELNGNFRVRFTMAPGLAGVVLGFRSGRTLQIVPDLIEHGFYFQSVAGHDMVQVVEKGAPKTAVAMRGAQDVFEIRRSAGHVTYWIGTKLIYMSAKPSVGAKIVNACLYASGDTVGGNA